MSPDAADALGPARSGSPEPQTRDAFRRLCGAWDTARDGLLRRAESAEADAVRLRGMLIRRQTEIAVLRERLARRHAGSPDRPDRLDPARETRHPPDPLAARPRALAAAPPRRGRPRRDEACGRPRPDRPRGRPHPDEPRSRPRSG